MTAGNIGSFNARYRTDTTFRVVTNLSILLAIFRRHESLRYSFRLPLSLISSFALPFSPILCSCHHHRHSR
jgi:hypothetical protein